MPPDDNDTVDHKKPVPADDTAGPKPNSSPRSETSSGPVAPRVLPALDMANFLLAIKQYRLALLAVAIAVLTLVATISPEFLPREAGSLWLTVRGPQKDQVRLPKVDLSKFTVLVAELDHDKEDSAREAIVVALEDTAGIVVDRLDAVIPAGETSEVTAGHERARKYLNDSGAKLLIWGSRLVVDGHERINLYFTSLQPPDTDTAKLYTLDPQPELVIDPSFLGNLVQAVQLAVVDYATAGHDTENCSNIARQLNDLIDDVRRRVNGDRARDWSPITRVSVRLSLAAALWTFGEITGTWEPFTDAIDVDRSAISEAKPRSEVWASAQFELGRSYLFLAEWETPAEKVQILKKALESFQSTLGVFRSGGSRAVVQLMIGTCLVESAAAASVDNPPNEHTIQEALTRFRDALRSIDRQRQPLLWGQANALLGAGLAASGLTPGDHRIVLVEAQSAFRASLELTRQGNALAWAAAQTMSGITSIALSKSDSPNGSQHLRDSVEAFNQALTVETRSCTPLEWADTQHELGDALTLLGLSENNATDLRKAEEAYHAELDVHTNGSFPYNWARAQTGLSGVLTLRGSREHNPVLVCQAIYRALLCADVNQYCTQQAAQIVETAYDTFKCVFDEPDRQKCQAKLEWEFAKPFYLSSPDLNASGLVCRSSGK
jgi:tetratricopeptide (TPR) repeat protein